MTDSAVLDILKRAILLEKRGYAFYRQAADQAAGTAVKNFFDMMAQEETRHVDILSDQYRSYMETGHFKPAAHDRDVAEVSRTVLTQELKDKISAAGFEAAAISAAMAMEQRAISLYSRRAREADDAEEKALYQWLAEWEGDHLRWLSDLDRELTEKVWNDNQFWPF